jgi:dinuclear metal center YbgI/SA1388 family protein
MKPRRIKNTCMTVKDLSGCLEEFAPLIYQESYDNSGLLIGDPGTEIQKVLFTLDLTEAVLDEAIDNKCNLVVCHHPLIFHGITKLSEGTSVNRMIIRAIRSDIAIYAMHTNLDNSVRGLNRIVSEMLGLKNCSVLSPFRGKLFKLVTFCPLSHVGQVRDAMFHAGAGHIGNYDSCSFNLSGQGTFRALEGANPFVGEKNYIHYEDETRIEVIFPGFLEKGLINALKKSHPYEEVAYDIYPLSNSFAGAGSGMTGLLEKELPAMEFLEKVKSIVGIPVIRHSETCGRMIRKVAVCTGSGGFLIDDAMRSGADIFLTSDLKYHDFFKVDDKMILADIGHFESEKFAKELMADILIRKFPTFAYQISVVNTNPVKYL